MQASPAKNEVRLPRAVLERSARLQASLDARTPPESETAPEPKPTEVAPPQPPVDPRENDAAYWKQRFNVANGMAKSSGEELRHAQAAWERQKSELNAQIQALQASAPAPATDLSRFFTPEQIEKFGEEQCRTMATAAEAAADAKIQAAIKTQVQPLVEARRQDQDAAVRDRKVAFEEALTEAYPSWREVDVSPAWVNWLAQADESTGLGRQDILNRHGQRLDAARIAGMFRQFEESTRPPAPPMAPHGTAGTGGGNAPLPSAAAVGGYPSQAEIKQFYKNSALSKVTESERAAFEARLKLRAA